MTEAGQPGQCRLVRWPDSPLDAGNDGGQNFSLFFVWTSSDRLGEGAGSGMTSPAIGLTRVSVGSVEVESYRFDFYRYRSILLAESDFDYCVCF